MRQVFNGPVGEVRVVHGDHHIHHHRGARSAVLPDDPERAVLCWQCRSSTWRYTATCVHCGVRLRRWWLSALLVGLRRRIAGER